jgi:hypothetical protein
VVVCLTPVIDLQIEPNGFLNVRVKILVGRLSGEMERATGKLFTLKVQVSSLNANYCITISTTDYYQFQ